MKNLILFLAILCGGVTVMSFMTSMHAATAGSFTGQFCGTVSPLCQSPVALGLATASLASLWISAMLVSVLTSG
jgi:hypothetical protein